MRRGQLLWGRSRGAAAVEMSISLLILVPVFLYALFLDDLLRYSLDAQEAALSTVWDFTVQDYSRPLAEGSGASPPGGRTRVQGQARLLFCDHESGIDSYQQGGAGKYRDCEETDHHQALAAHVCWINDQAKQVTCDPAEKMAGALGDTLHTSYQHSFTNGGLIRCSARAVVENYLLPEQFLAQFSSKKALTKKKWGGSGAEIHENSDRGTFADAYFLKQQQLAILSDTWALTRAEDLRPGCADPTEAEDAAEPGGPRRRLRHLVEHVYKNNVDYAGLRTAVDEFSRQATSAQLLMPGLLSRADDPRKPNLAIAPHRRGTPTERIEQEGGPRHYFNTEWEDWERNHTPQTYQRRKAGYLGCAPETGC
jgi:hypothetical protein